MYNPIESHQLELIFMAMIHLLFRMVNPSLGAGSFRSQGGTQGKHCKPRRWTFGSFDDFFDHEISGSAMAIWPYGRPNSFEILGFHKLINRTCLIAARYRMVFWGYPQGIHDLRCVMTKNIGRAVGNQGMILYPRSHSESTQVHSSPYNFMWFIYLDTRI